MRLLFWRHTEERLNESDRRIASALAGKREREGRVLREVAKTTGSEEVMTVAEAREEEARRYRAAERRNEDFEAAYFGGADDEA